MSVQSHSSWNILDQVEGVDYLFFRHQVPSDYCVLCHLVIIKFLFINKLQIRQVILPLYFYLVSTWSERYLNPKLNSSSILYTLVVIDMIRYPSWYFHDLLDISSRIVPLPLEFYDTHRSFSSRLLFPTVSPLQDGPGTVCRLTLISVFGWLGPLLRVWYDGKRTNHYWEFERNRVQIPLT